MISREFCQGCEGETGATRTRYPSPIITFDIHRLTKLKKENAYSPCRSRPVSSLNSGVPVDSKSSRTGLCTKGTKKRASICSIREGCRMPIRPYCLGPLKSAGPGCNAFFPPPFPHALRHSGEAGQPSSALPVYCCHRRGVVHLQKKVAAIEIICQCP